MYNQNQGGYQPYQNQGGPLMAPSPNRGPAQYQDPYNPHLNQGGNPYPGAQNYGSSPNNFEMDRGQYNANDEFRPLEDDDDGLKLSTNARSGFVMKVYGILCYQFAITCGFLIWVWAHSDFKKAVEKNQWSMWVALTLAMVCQYALFCYREIARSVPINYILLTVFTCAYSWMVACITVQYPLETVLYAAGLTLLMTICLTAYAYFIKVDLFMLMPLLLVC